MSNVTYATCANCDEPIVKLSDKRWRHCANTSRWCASLLGSPLPQGPVAEPKGESDA